MDPLRGKSVAVIGGGPAGLMAAETLAGAGLRVDLYDAMPSVGRKFLMAGKGGMNLTHAEPIEAFVGRYGTRQPWLEPMLRAFGPGDLRAWAQGLGIETFVGSSRRVFPVDMKAAPLLRAWLHRLRQMGVQFHVRHRWRGWDERNALCFATVAGTRSVQADVVVLALGGASWPQLGSDGAWVPMLTRHGVRVEALRPANCGFDVNWSDRFRERFAGAVIKPVIAGFTDSAGVCVSRQGEIVVTASGVEGGLIYALSSRLREAIAATGSATIYLNLAPGRSLERLMRDLSRPRGSRSMANHLRSNAGIDGVKAGLLRETLTAQQIAAPLQVSAMIKCLPLRLVAPRPIEEAISTAGGVSFEALDGRLMLMSLPGVFCAGEMLDWEAPTGGYLFTACFASGRAAGLGVLAWLNERIA